MTHDYNQLELELDDSAETKTIYSLNYNLLIAPPFIDGDIRYWVSLVCQMSARYSRMRVKRVDDGVAVEFYSPWYHSVSSPKTKTVQKKPWWRFW